MIGALAVHFEVWDRTVGVGAGSGAAADSGPGRLRYTVVCSGARARDLISSLAPDGTGRRVTLHAGFREFSLHHLEELLYRGDSFWVEVSRGGE